MIHDRLENAAFYSGLSPRFEAAFAWLAANDLPSLAEGRIAIEGDDIYALVQRYRTEGREGKAYETHRVYADIQVLVRGRELIAWRPADGLEEAQAYDPAKDFAGWKDSGGVELPLEAGDFALFFPQDAHLPKLAAGEGAEVMKVVVKVRV
jgi:biofilm protein TabA